MNCFTNEIIHSNNLPIDEQSKPTAPMQINNNTPHASEVVTAQSNTPAVDTKSPTYHKYLASF